MEGQKDFIPNNHFNDEIKLEVFQQLTQSEVKDIVKNSTFTTCGTDPMPLKVIKLHLEVLLPMITRMVNYFLMARVFNESWKNL